MIKIPQHFGCISLMYYFKAKIQVKNHNLKSSSKCHFVPLGFINSHITLVYHFFVEKICGFMFTIKYAQLFVVSFNPVPPFNVTIESVANICE